MTHTATFRDTWHGSTAMHLVEFRTTKAGKKTVAYRWAPIDAPGCIASGYRSFPTIDSALSAIKHDRRWS